MGQRPAGTGRLATIHHEAFITPAKRSPSPEQQDLSGEASRRQLFQSKAAAGSTKANGEEEEVQSKKRQCSGGDSTSCVDVDCPSKGSQQRCRRLFGLPPSTERTERYFQELEEQAREAFHKRWNVDAPTMQPDGAAEWLWCLEQRPPLAPSPAGTKHPRNILELPGPL